MRVFHASSVVVAVPDTLHSRDFLDFGPGFYVTTIERQAVDYGQRFLRRGFEAWVNSYEMADDFAGLRVLAFESYDEAWLDFVSECRKGKVSGDWDVVSGGIANDKVFRTLDLYFSGDISKQDALRRLVFEKPNFQICFRTEVAVKQCLSFLNAQKL